MDISLSWTPAGAHGDWVMLPGDLATGDDLASAVLVSLFTDRLAAPDDGPLDSAGNRRGWWADAYTGDPIGSRLWLLERAKKTDSLLRVAESYVREALQWLLDDAVADAIDVLTEWAPSGRLGIQITIHQPSGPARMRFEWAWNTLAA